MPSLTELVGLEALARLATLSNLRLGRDIAGQGGVELVQTEPMRVSAKVGAVAAAGQRRTVELAAGPSGLEWSCACTRRLDFFCKHCVATALVAWCEAPAGAAAGS